MRLPMMTAWMREGAAWQHFREPREVLVANRLDEVCVVVEEAERRALDGSCCVGYIAYEAAPAFDSALAVKDAIADLPLVIFGVFESSHDTYDELPDSALDGPAAIWAPEIGQEAYDLAIASIRRLIASGDTYQVNFSYRLRCEQPLDPMALFADMALCGRTQYSACLEFDDHAVVSASPELFFELKGHDMVSKPMKGTAPRGRFLSEDARLAHELSNSEKNRAENLMIVDMVRNDLGRIAEIGSVKVDRLFEVETYSTVHQMVSTVRAKTDAAIVDLLRATFPPASVTGAPKKRTMEIIRDLELSPRGVYTGCIGVLGPGRSARMSVAIRTAVLNKKGRYWEYGIGGGIVWDSLPAAEYDECLTKARVLVPSPRFELLETIKWSRAEGYAHLEGHVRRMVSSATLFDIPLSEVEVHCLLEDIARARPEEAIIVRLLCDAKGRLRYEVRPYRPWPEDRPVRIAVSSIRVNPEDRMLFHKTTLRDLYECAAAEHPDCDEVLLLNRDGFVTEGTFSNIAVLLDGHLVTPPLEQGLLPGVLREALIVAGSLTEHPVLPTDLGRAKELWVFNSVRGMARGERAR